ncbi:MAG: tRNA 2-thiocytidine(32) synthetase TtcA [Steroidobacteraceae bacterium]
MNRHKHLGLDPAFAPAATDPAAGEAREHRTSQTRTSKTFKRLQARLRGLVGKAIEDFRMIEDGDRVMVCLSGGKDSYTMLDVLLSLQRSAPIRFELIAVNLDQKQPGFPQHVLPDYLAALGVPFHVIEQDTYRVVKRVIPEGRTMCGLCSRLRRGALYRYASENGITKVALGHHRDDIVETLFLNMFFGGRLKTMPPKLLSEDGRHIVIRPMAYVPEREIERYARARQFPIIPCTLCGSQQQLQRVTVKKMLTDWEREFPGRTEAIFSSLSNVTTSHLADPQAFDFAGLEARRAAAVAALQQASFADADAAATPITSGREPWEEL